MGLSGLHILYFVTLLIAYSYIILMYLNINVNTVFIMFKKKTFRFFNRTKAFKVYSQNVIANIYLLLIFLANFFSSEFIIKSNMQYYVCELSWLISRFKSKVNTNGFCTYREVFVTRHSHTVVSDKAPPPPPSPCFYRIDDNPLTLDSIGRFEF